MKTFKLKNKPDFFIPIIGIGLSLFGLVMVLSSSQISAAERYDDPYYFFFQQLIALLIGLVGFFILYKIKLDILYRYRFYLLIASIILLILVFVPGIGGQTAGVYRWISIGFINFQPSDVVKLFLLIYLSAWLAEKGDEAGSFLKGFVPFIVIIGVISILIELGRDLDTLVVILVMSLSIFFVAKSRLSHFFLMLVAGIGLAVLLLISQPYRMERFNVLIQGGDNQEAAFHINQALIAIGSGGLLGVGFGQGISKYFYLPESHTDSIFAVISEELGFLRTSLVLIAFLFLAWRIFLIARSANSRFVQLLAVGGGTLLTFQSLVNIGGMLGLIPLSGITLPFISYGGSSLIISLAVIGLMTNISREVNEKN